jgi:hypothetical protein
MFMPASSAAAAEQLTRTVGQFTRKGETVREWGVILIVAGVLAMMVFVAVVAHRDGRLERGSGSSTPGKVGWSAVVVAVLGIAGGFGLAAVDVFSR